MSYKGEVRKVSAISAAGQSAACRLRGLLAVSLLLGMLPPIVLPAGEQKQDRPTAEANTQRAGDAEPQPKSAAPARPKDRAASAAAILSHLGVGEGAVVADVGAGKGDDTWTFAKIVGEKGTVYAEEISDGSVKALKKEIEKKKLSNVRAVLGCEDDPRLPAGSVDLVFTRYVYHHFSKPREMLRGIWKALKPGGYFVVADRERGTLRNWVERKVRSKKHYWIAETTVVREAREEGFTFVGLAEDCWHEKDPFVLVFQRPKDPKSPGGDPDPFLPLSVEKTAGLLVPLGQPYERPVFVALGEGRKLLAPLLEHGGGQPREIVLEEWATQKEERPALPPGVSFPSVLTDKGDPGLGAEPVDVVFFLDSYHLLFHGKTLLAKIHERLSPTGCIYVLDREGKDPLARREASHRRKISPQAVKQEMAEAGFFLWAEGPRPAADRFLLVFGKTKPEQVRPEADPLVGGPEIGSPPEQWLKESYWRLRGMKTADGRYVPFAAKKPDGPPKLVAKTAASPGKEAWEVPGEKVVLEFEKKGEAHVLTDYRAVK